MGRFIRVARPIAMASGPLAIASIITEFSVGSSPAAMASTAGITAAILALLAVLALLIGVIGIYAAQASELPGPGLTGLLLTMVGAVLTAGGVWSSVFVVPGLAEAAPSVLETGLPSVVAGFIASYTMLGIGGLLFGTSVLKAGNLPRASAVLLIVGGVVCLAPLPARYFLLAVAVSLASARLQTEDDRIPTRVQTASA